VGEPVEVKIVGLREEDLKTLIENLSKFVENANKFFEQSFTTTGRLKVAAIPIPIGATEEMIENLSELPELITSLTQELKELKEVIKAEKESK